MTRNIPTKFIAAALAVASLGSTALGSVDNAVAHSSKSKTRVTIQREEIGFSGFVLSKNEDCHNGRKVLLFKKGDRHHRTKFIGQDIAEPNGDGSQWFIQNNLNTGDSASKEGGKYYAKVKSTSECKGAKSRVIRSQADGS